MRERITARSQAVAAVWFPAVIAAMDAPGSYWRRVKPGEAPFRNSFPPLNVDYGYIDRTIDREVDAAFDRLTSHHT